MESLFEWECLDERGDVKPTTLWDFKDVNSERGTEMFIKYLGFNKADFPNPKPIGTIERVLKIATSQDDIILDSFAGSGTTAQAVLNMSKADGGNRKFIFVEMMDYADSLTSERVKRVITGYGERKTKVGSTGGSFSYYELGDTFMNGDELNETVGVDKIREYVYFTETKSRLAPFKDDEPYYLGTHIATAYYFYYDRENVTTLSRAFCIWSRQKRIVMLFMLICVLCQMQNLKNTTSHSRKSHVISLSCKEAELWN